jgi:hypothetical protein
MSLLSCKSGHQRYSRDAWPKSHLSLMTSTAKKVNHNLSLPKDKSKTLRVMVEQSAGWSKMSTKTGKPLKSSKQTSSSSRKETWMKPMLGNLFTSRGRSQPSPTSSTLRLGLKGAQTPYWNLKKLNPPA